MRYTFQNDSYVKSLLQISVIAVTQPTESNALWGVELRDTVCFPGGGGQANDLGVFNGSIAIENVSRTHDGSVVHWVRTPFAVGDLVDVEVDWSRRFDNMQKHSSQHVLSGIAEGFYGLQTDCW